MSTLNAEKLLAPPTTCVKQDSDTETLVTSDTPLQGRSPACTFPKSPSVMVMILSGSWFMEFLCMFLCFALFGVYCGFLSFLNGKPEDDLKFLGILSTIFTNLGSLLSQVSVIFRLLMFVPVSSAMGQLSWYRFWNAASRPVSDLQTFDAASRGLSGSVRLLLSRHIFNSFHTTLGAILTLAALYLGSSMQNAARLNETELLPWQDEVGQLLNASIPFMDNFDLHLPNDWSIAESGDEYADPRMESSLYSAWVYSMNLTSTAIPNRSNISDTAPVNCGSNWCAWENYTTLAVRSRCQSVATVMDSNGFVRSDQANISTSAHALMQYNTSAPIQSFLNFKTSKTIPETSNLTESFPYQSVIIVHLSAISVDDLHPAEAVECILYWEVQHFSKLQYDPFDSVFHSEQTRHIAPKEGQPTDAPEIVFEAPCNNKNNNNKPCNYTVKGLANLELQRSVAEFFNGSVLPHSRNSNRFKASGKSTEMFAQAYFASSATKSQKPLASFLDDYMSFVAGDVSGNILSTAKQLSIGKPQYLGQRYLIKWYNVIYSGTMMVISAYIFFFAVWKTRQMPVWKTSLLPFLYHGGLQHQPHEDGYDLSHLAWMEKASRTRRVALRDEHDGLGLRLRDLRQSTGCAFGEMSRSDLEWHVPPHTGTNAEVTGVGTVLAP